MHTPDGFITSWICVITLLFSLGLIVYSAIRLQKTMTKENAYLMSGLAAAIFAFQMLNFSIGGGTSGHLIGAALVAILLGPEAAVLVLSAVLLVQTLIFADGGLLAIGVNIFIMGVVASYAAHYAHQLLRKRLPILSGMFASVISVVVAAFTLSLLLGVSKTVPFGAVIPAMVITHFFVGLGEGLITGALLFSIKQSKQLLLTGQQNNSLVRNVLFSTLGSYAIMAVALPFASTHPDGLASVAINLGFFGRGVELFMISPFANYEILGNGSYLFVLGSCLMGMLLTFGLSYVVTKKLIPTQA
ncbi:MAG: energy-coupling factor ABC transporter permease [Candidatus Woesearchaeota archaeon]|nr:MAG: energy-coupling factor ABC transporter permease [Candidatus Woesearchaeota archaeon]